MRSGRQFAKCKSLFPDRFCLISRGVHWTPALMKFYVLQKCFDIMEIMYSFVAANLVRQSQRLQNRCELTQYIVSQHIILYNKNCIRAFLGHLMQSLYLTIFSNRQRWHTADLNFTFSTQNKNYLFLF